MVWWFISPWEAARISIEAQRMIAARFLGFGFAFPGAQDQTQQAEERTHKERTSDREKASANSDDPSSASSQLARKRAIAALTTRM
jgi:hypothetical protein